MHIEDVVGMVTELRGKVRSGYFDGPTLLLAERCWHNRSLLAPGDVNRLRIHTLVWEVFDARGDYSTAVERLVADNLVKHGIDLINIANQDPRKFIAEEFPKRQSIDQKEEKYDLWRQRVMGMLAQGFASYRLQLSNSGGDYFQMARRFLEMCLAETGFHSYGTRSRLHYFVGHLLQRNQGLDEAGKAFEESLKCCLDRLRDRENQPVSEYASEQAFAVYGLGKLEYKLAEIDLGEGRLRSARQHAIAARALLRTSGNQFLIAMADLLYCQIDRYNFSSYGWRLVDEMARCRRVLTDHRPFWLEAEIEIIKTCVYLREKGIAPQTNDALYLDVDAAAKQIIPVIAEASELKLLHTAFQALLVKARILYRICESKREITGRAPADLVNAANSAVDEAVALFARNPPRRLQAEAWFVYGKLHSARRPATALEYFRKALGAGHTSVTFQAACWLQIADMSHETGNLTDAGDALKHGRKLLRSVEHIFLHERLEKLRLRVEPHISVFRYDKALRYEEAKGELDKKYLSWLGNGRLEDAIKHARDSKEPRTTLSRSQIRTMIRNLPKK